MRVCVCVWKSKRASSRQPVASRYSDSYQPSTIYLSMFPPEHWPLSLSTVGFISHVSKAGSRSEVQTARCMGSFPNLGTCLHCAYAYF